MYIWVSSFQYQKIFAPETKTNMRQNLRPEKQKTQQITNFQTNTSNAHNENTRNMRVLGC